ncbi:hypothetical protein E2C01_098767 [Portunus trituberculatus]|uniref:Uncharacterized protein n=1 Tax=Portunus trituberculatus TaxID=210409 RepID=A0A5B7K929_PORTR|nr:hypothetical protein [Portunus trituberculatus]
MQCPSGNKEAVVYCSKCQRGASGGLGEEEEEEEKKEEEEEGGPGKRGGEGKTGRARGGFGISCFSETMKSYDE